MLFAVAEPDIVAEEEEEEAGVPYESLRPTYTHEALCKLLDEGYLHYIISQNGDGLHLLSGILVHTCNIISVCKQKYQNIYTCTIKPTIKTTCLESHIPVSWAHPSLIFLDPHCGSVYI